jgi:hypothetical protein
MAISIPTPTAAVAGGFPQFRAGRPSGGSQARPAGAVKGPGVLPGLTPADLEEIKEALYEFELTRGDWAKSH